MLLMSKKKRKSQQNSYRFRIRRKNIFKLKVNCVNDVFTSHLILINFCWTFFCRKISIQEKYDEGSNNAISVMRLNSTEQHDSGHYTCQVSFSFLFCCSFKLLFEKSSVHAFCSHTLGRIVDKNGNLRKSFCLCLRKVLLCKFEWSFELKKFLIEGSLIKFSSYK